MVDIGSVLSSFNIVDAQSVIVPLALFVIGMTIYAVFIFKFYRFLAKKNIIRLHLDKRAKGKMGALKNFLRVVLYLFEHFVLFPVVVFFWFATLSIIILLLSKSQSVENVLLIAISLVGSVRVTAYYSEDLSRDLAKMIPFALLGVFLVDTSFFSLDTALTNIQKVPTLWKTIVYYMVFIVIMEFLLKVISHVVGHFRKDSEKPKESLFEKGK